MGKSSGRTGNAGVSEPAGGRRRRPTATSRFGVSRRENHDASEFYERFPKPEISEDEQVNPAAAVDEIWVGDAREIDRFGQIADGSVALVVTSPPYFAGKEYESAIGQGHVPESYIAYLDMLRAVFAECERKLEPGGRIAVNVANLGRKPYRSLAADVTDILQGLGLLLRGEIIWVKGKAAGGSCAWGTFKGPGNPVLRDLSERIVIASKGRFSRAKGARLRANDGLPSVATISADEFMDLTVDVWELLPESATRVGHPAPFPVELPRRLIDLYTYEGDLVLDPFMGSGTTAVAAVRTGRHYVGFDTDPTYVAQADERIARERELLERDDAAAARAVRLPARPATADGLDAVQLAAREGRKATDLAHLLLEEAGFTHIRRDAKVAAGLEVTFRADDVAGNRWLFEVAGGFSNANPGLRRSDTLWRVLGKASVLAAAEPDTRLVLLTTDLPSRTGAGHRALAAVTGTGPHHTVVDVVRLLDDGDFKRLRALAEGRVDDPADD